MTSFLGLFQGKGGDVELESFALELEAYEGDVLFAEADDEAAQI